MSVDMETRNQEPLEPTTVEKLSKLPYAIGYDAANSVFAYLTFFGSVFVLYLAELGFSKTQIGFILSLLPFLVLVSLFSGPIVDRLGNKRTFLSFWFLRSVVTVGLLFVPWVLASYGEQAALIFVVAITTGFSMFKAVALTGLLPWQQEYIPEQIRGKYFAMSNIATSLSGLFAMGISGLVLDRSSGLNGYTLLFGLGVLFAAIAIGFSMRVPGGESRRRSSREKRRFFDVLRPLSDRGFILFLSGGALITLATGPLGNFLPLFMEEKVGLSPGNIVYLGTGALLGGVLTSYFWGWASDRYGSRPVMISGLLFKTVYPVLLMLVPRQAAASLPIAMAVYFYGGFANMGWAIGSSRLLFGRLIPRERASDYSAVYHSWLGVFGGVSALLGGWILDRYVDFQSDVMGIRLDAYTILFLAGILLPLAAILLLRRVRADSAVSMGQFAGLFYHGNPIMAMESMIRFYRARDEAATISITERLGQSHSPLTVNELLEALEDPRFLVRFEALISIGRLGSDERLRASLIEILHGEDPALSVLAAWALGRTRDPLAIEPLRTALDSRYRSVRAHVARSLAGLGDTEVVPILEELLEQESDPGLRVVYASSLAKLESEGAIPEILGLMRTTKSEIVRKEMALALARLIGNENAYIQLLRQVRQDPGTTLSQATMALRKKLEALHPEEEALDLVDRCAGYFARGDLEQGVMWLVALIGILPQDQIPEPYRPILGTCVAQTKSLRSSQLEYPILVLHLLREIL